MEPQDQRLLEHGQHWVGPDVVAFQSGQDSGVSLLLLGVGPIEELQEGIQTSQAVREKFLIRILLDYSTRTGGVILLHYFH